MGDVDFNDSKSNSTSWSTPMDNPTTPVSIPSFLYIIIIDVLAIFGNVLLAIVIVRSKKLRSSLTYWFVLNLCLIDIMACTIVLPVTAIGVFHGKWVMSAAICNIIGFLNTFCNVASILAVCAISVERFYVIKLPMEHASVFTGQRAVLVLTYVWAQCILLGAFPIFGWNRYEYQSAIGICSFVTNVTGTQQLYVAILFFFGFVVPGVIMLFMYYGIYKVAQTVSLRVQPLPACLLPELNFTQVEQHASNHEEVFSQTRCIVANCSHHSEAGGRFTQPQVEVNIINSVSIPIRCTESRISLNETPLRSFVTTAVSRGQAVATAPVVRVNTPTVAGSSSTSATEDITPELCPGSASTQTPSSSQNSDQCLGNPQGCPSKAIKTLIFIMLAYLTLWGPYFLVTIYRVVNGDVTAATLVGVTWLAYASFGLNPVIYGWMNRVVREEVFDCFQSYLHTCISGDHEDNEEYGPSEDFCEFLERTSTAQTLPRTTMSRAQVRQSLPPTAPNCDSRTEITY